MIVHQQYAFGRAARRLSVVCLRFGRHHRRFGCKV
jgi:hypothetical protein